MFNPIRELIAQNKIAQALADCGELDLSPSNRSRLISLRRRWDLLTEQAIAQTQEERLLRLEENGLVEDLLKWLDHMEYATEAKEEWSVKVTHTKQGTGAAAGTGDGSVKGKAKWPWVVAAVIALLAVSWMLWPPTGPPGEATTEAREVRERAPADGTSTENPTPPAREEPPVTTPTNPGRTQVNPGDLVAVDPGKIDLSKVDPARVPLNPNLRLNPEALKKIVAANALMTSGEQVDIAVALYRNTQAPTKYDAEISKELAAFLNRETGNMQIVADVLTQKFHEHEKRERLLLRGIFDSPGLSAGRARYLLLADVRSIDSRGKADLRLCLFDVERGKGFSSPASIYVGPSSSRLQVKELFYAARDYLKEMRERGLLQ